MQDDLQKIYGWQSGESATEIAINSGKMPTSNGDILSSHTLSAASAKDNALISSTSDISNTLVNSVYDALPVNAVDTFGTNPVLVGGNVELIPANIPIVFSYTVNVPQGRTFVLRKFYFVPTRFLYDENNNPIQDLFTITFLVNGSPVSENSSLIFPAWGTGGFVDAFFIAPENSTVQMRVSINNASYVDLEPSFPIYMGASMALSFNALLSNGLPANFQIANVEKADKSESFHFSGSSNSPFVRKYFGSDK